jgi:PAS domain-containing protein
MARPTYDVTPGWLSKMSGIPKATIVNWLEGRVRRPRTSGAVLAISEALRLTAAESGLLYAAADLPQSPEFAGPAACDRVPVGLYATTVSGRILYANSTLVQMLGYSCQDRYRALDVGSDLYARPAARRAWLAAIERADTLLRQPVWAKRSDGTRVLLLDSATAIRDARGHILSFEGVWELAPATWEPD